MKKNKYDERNQEIRSLEMRSSDISKMQRENCWVELEVPEKHGWYIRMVMRSDIANRVDADTFQSVIDLVERPQWNKRKKTGVRHKGNTCHITGKRDWEELFPWSNTRFGSGCHYGVSYEKWVTLRPEVKRWFTPPTHLDYWGRGWCTCNIPVWHWERKLERCYATHYKVLDTELESEGAWIDNKLWSNSKYYGKSKNAFRCSGAPKWFVKDRNRQLREKNKQTIRTMKQFGYDEDSAEFSKYVHDAAWLWW